ncbi:MAG: response regulator [Spongiibacteraceae bacterium]|nr:response regulator [Spongiibacteraceae bacterium]
MASKGDQALELLSGASFDLLIMDVEMRGLNGFDVTLEIRIRFQD